MKLLKSYKEFSDMLIGEGLIKFQWICINQWFYI